MDFTCAQLRDLQFQLNSAQFKDSSAQFHAREFPLTLISHGSSFTWWDFQIYYERQS